MLAHQEIYKSRPDVAAICRVQPPKLISLSTMARVPAPRHGFGAFVDRLLSDPQLVRTPLEARELAALHGDRNAIVMRGNGAIVVADAIERAVVLASYLEDAARVELDILHTTTAVDGLLLSDEEARSRATWTGGITERTWAYLTSGDCDPPTEA